MTLVDLIKHETAGSRRDIVLAAGLSAIANAGLLGVINHAIRDASSETQSLRAPLMFLIAFVLYVICFRKTFHEVSAVVEDILMRLRIRVADRIRQADLVSLEGVDQGEIFSVLTTETAVISQSTGALAAALQASILLAFASLYLVLLSAPAFLFCVVLVGSGIPAYVSASASDATATR